MTHRHHTHQHYRRRSRPTARLTLRAVYDDDPVGLAIEMAGYLFDAIGDMAKLNPHGRHLPSRTGTVARGPLGLLRASSAAGRHQRLTHRLDRRGNAGELLELADRLRQQQVQTRDDP